jgi:hypothetical protein
MYEWLQLHWTEVVAVAGAVMLASRVALYLLAVVAHALGKQNIEDEATALQKAVDGVASGLKVTALNIPKIFQGTGDGGKATLLLLFLLPTLALGCQAGQNVRNAQTLEALGVSKYMVNNEKILDATIAAFEQARIAAKELATKKAIDLIKAKAANGLPASEVEAAVLAVTENREKVDRQTATIVASIRKMASTNEKEAAKAMQIHAKIAEWMEAGFDASEVPKAIDDLNVVLEAVLKGTVVPAASAATAPATGGK